MGKQRWFHMANEEYKDLARRVNDGDGEIGYNPLEPKPREMPSIKAILDTLNTGLAKHKLTPEQYMKVVSNVLASLLADKSDLFADQWRLDFDRLLAQYKGQKLIKGIAKDITHG
jgi:hypothetical protein